MSAIDRLTAFSYEEETFEKIDLTGADLSGKELVQCVFRDVKLNESVWSRARFEDCVFERCDLTGAKVARLSLRGVDFRDCKSMGVDWSAVESGPVVSFTDCAMRYQSFVAMDLRGARFLRCSLIDSTFVDVNLGKVKLAECDLGKTVFERCDLTACDLSTSRGVYFDPAKNKIKGARISPETASLMATALGLVVK